MKTAANRGRGNLLVDRLEVFAETVHELAERRDIKELELGAEYSIDEALVQTARRSQRAIEDPDISHQRR